MQCVMLSGMIRGAVGAQARPNDMVFQNQSGSLNCTPAMPHMLMIRRAKLSLIPEVGTP